MASRKDYVAAAGAIKKVKSPMDRARLALKFASIYSADNPRFDRTRFLKACGYSERKRTSTRRIHSASRQHSGFFSW